MISLKITGCCADCRFIDLDLRWAEYLGGKVYCLKCTHEDICGKLEKEASHAKTDEDVQPG